MLIDELVQLGLTTKEAMIYITSLELGPCGIVELANKSKLNRTTLYASIEKLIEKKLFTIGVKGKKKIYTAEPPEKLKYFVKQKLEKVNKIFPELASLIGKGEIKPKIKYFEGVEGIKNITREIISAKEEAIIGFVGAEALSSKSKELIEFWEKEMAPKRKKAGKIIKQILPDNEVGKKLKKMDKQSFRESRLVPSSSYNFECEILIYDNVTIFVSYFHNEEFALSLESKTIANTLKMIWKMCWNMGY